MAVYVVWLMHFVEKKSSITMPIMSGSFHAYNILLVIHLMTCQKGDIFKKLVWHVLGAIVCTLTARWTFQNSNLNILTSQLRVDAVCRKIHQLMRFICQS